ncbi:MAG: hypothetical protein A2173_06370 [Planctomycetes bacterium RBG_13_44_8b]|nr:MAG: hypothetical protein A2173_06370 [Planctomycetes bacterium RBG_13_44_8b]
MDTGAMVGLIGLTFFCNKCVEVFYKFKKNGIVSDELQQTCKRAISAFKSLKWPRETDLPDNEEKGLFNTNEEIESFERVLESESKSAEDILGNLIKDLEFILQDNTSSLEDRRKVAGNLQSFFDTLGDYSFYATRDCLRSSESMTGV